MDKRSSNMPQDRVTLASEFFIEFRSGDGTPAVRARFAKWLRSSPENVKAYLAIAAGWSELPTGDPEDRIDIRSLLAPVHGAKDDNIINLVCGRACITRPPNPHLVAVRALAASAALLVLLGLVGAWVLTQGGPTYNTDIGEQRTLILADGSTIILNALTTVRVQMTKHTREVTLVRGQAYFHDKDELARPFIVRTGTSAVRAIGTAFDVDQEPGRTVVTVLKGQVAITQASAWIDSIARRELLREPRPVDKLKAVLVSAGQQVIVRAPKIAAPSPVDVTQVTAWMQQRLVFDGTPLEKVAQQFNLYSKRRLVIADFSLRSVGVSGQYSLADPAALIGFLRSQPMLNVVETDDEFIVTRR